jgi:hypothetical protein
MSRRVECSVLWRILAGDAVSNAASLVFDCCSIGKACKWRVMVCASQLDEQNVSEEGSNCMNADLLFHMVRQAHETAAAYDDRGEANLGQRHQARSARFVESLAVGVCV